MSSVVFLKLFLPVGSFFGAVGIFARKSSIYEEADSYVTIINSINSITLQSVYTLGPKPRLTCSIENHLHFSEKYSPML